jgi:hypothetical protein
MCSQQAFSTNQHTFVMVAVTKTVWKPRLSGFEARCFNGARNLRISGPKPRSNIVSASSNTCKQRQLSASAAFGSLSYFQNCQLKDTHHVLDVTIYHISLLNMLKNPARGTNYHIDRVTKWILLRPKTATTTYHGTPESCMMAYRFSNSENL